MTDEEYEAELLSEEQRWLMSADLKQMYRCTFGRTTSRKYRLLCVASCWCLDVVIDDPCRLLLNRLEQSADAPLSPADEEILCRDARCYEEKFTDTVWSDSRTVAQAMVEIADRCYDDAFDSISPTPEEGDTGVKLQRRVCAILFEVFGNPFRPVAFNPVWRTSDVMALANGIYAERAFDRMPILADALQDAGCDSPDILNHLRDEKAAHVRGCWSLDLVLGKE